MAVQITDENFEQYFDQYFDAAFNNSMGEQGKAIEDDNDVPSINASAIVSSPDNYTLPLVRSQNGNLDYVKVAVGGENGLIQAVADEVETTGMLEAMEESEFDAIFT